MTAWAPDREFSTLVLRDSCKVMTEAIGFRVAHSQALEKLCSVLKEKLMEYAHKTRDMMECTGRTSPIIEDAMAAFKLLYVDIPQLIDYTTVMRDEEWLYEFDTPMARVLRQLNAVPAIVGPSRDEIAAAEKRRALEMAEVEKRRAKKAKRKAAEDKLRAKKKAERLPDFCGMSYDELFGTTMPPTPIVIRLRLPTSSPGDDKENDENLSPTTTSSTASQRRGRGRPRRLLGTSQLPATEPDTPRPIRLRVKNLVTTEPPVECSPSPAQEKKKALRKKEKTTMCPGCGHVYQQGDNMVGCDGCDRWYHWHCVGLEAPPKKEQWYCTDCTPLTHSAKRRRRP